MEPTLKELRAKAKELRAKVSAAPISKATSEQLKNEISFFERAAKAEAQREQRLANLQKGRESKVQEVVPEKKKSNTKLVSREEKPVERAPKAKKRPDEYYED